MDRPQRLKAAGIRVLDLNEVGEIDTYIDGADETNHQRQLIKGGGAALTREKIIAAASRRFVCIADESKLVDTLGAFPLPVEVIPMARSHVSRALERLGGRPVWREQGGHRQRQSHPRRAWPAHQRPGGAGERHQPDRRRGHRGAVRRATRRSRDPRRPSGRSALLKLRPVASRRDDRRLLAHHVINRDHEEPP